MHPNLTWGSFSMEAIMPAALPTCYCSPGCFDNDLQLIFIFGSGVSYPLQILCGVQGSWLINQEAITWAANDLVVVFVVVVCWCLLHHQQSAETSHWTSNTLDSVPLHFSIFPPDSRMKRKHGHRPADVQTQDQNEEER